LLVLFQFLYRTFESNYNCTNHSLNNFGIANNAVAQRPFGRLLDPVGVTVIDRFLYAGRQQPNLQSGTIVVKPDFIK